MSLPRFFKVIHEQKEEIRIPRAIAKRYWKGLSNPIFLSLPNGDEWKIFWEKRDDDIWLQKNWKNFAQFYSLKFGSFLVFKYKGKSHLKVTIFQNNMVEIEYPRKTHARDSEGRHHDEEDEVSLDDSDEIITQTFKKKKTNSNGEPKSAPSERTNNNGKRKINVDFDATQQEISGAANRGNIVKARNCPKADVIRDISRNFNSENPFCVVILTPSYLQQNLMVLPCKFSREHLYGLEGTATIVVGDHEDLTSTWNVSFKFDYAKKRTLLGIGWKSFCEDNNLQVGHGCIFEIIQRDPAVTFKTYFRPSSEELQGYGHEANKNKPKRGAVDNMECFGNSSFRSFSKTRVRNYADSASSEMEPDKFEITVKSYYPNIPREFMKRHSRCHGNYVKLHVGEKWWDVKVLSFATHSRLCDGWCAFKRGCGLNIGDICVFEMVDEEKLEFNVSITRSQH